MVGRLLPLIVGSLMLGGCAAPAVDPGASPPTPTPVATPSLVVTAPSALPAMPSGATAAPDVTAVPSPSHAASPAAEAWDLLWVSDSSGSGGVPQAYADRLGSDLGVTVEVHPAWTGSLTAGTVLRTLRGANDGVLLSSGSGPVDLPELVRDADVIVVSGNPADSPTTGHPQGGSCAISYDPEPACESPTACGPDTWQQYEQDLVAIFDEIFRIRDGRPVVLRTHDWYLPWGPVATWRACDQVKVCAACFDEFSAAIHRAAASRGVPVAGYLHAFSGPDGDRPLPSDWTRDDVHPTAAGAEELAGVMADLGYDPVAPIGH